MTQLKSSRTRKKDFVHTSDFTTEDYDETLRRALLIECGLAAGQRFNHVLAGRVLGSLFLKESTRTMTAFQSAITRLGGGWTGLTGETGTYLQSGEEDIGDIVESIAQVTDIIVLRYNKCDPFALAKRISVPLINGMCGNDEHAIGALAIAYSLLKKRGTLRGAVVGIHGMVSSSRPMKALVGVLAPFATRIVIDPVISEFRVPSHIEEHCKAAGSTIEYAPLSEWIGEVDFIGWAEGLPQAGEAQASVDKFNAAFRPFMPADYARMRSDALICASMPRKTTDGRLTFDSMCDGHPMSVTFPVLNDFQYVAMGIMSYLLDAPL